MDVFFELYKKNIACYYNAKKILKIIHDETTNIPPTVSEMLIVHETNATRIKTFNEETYHKHRILVKTVMCNLFYKKTQEMFLFDGIKSYLEHLSQTIYTLSPEDTEYNNEKNIYSAFLKGVVDEMPDSIRNV